MHIKNEKRVRARKQTETERRRKKKEREEDGPESKQSACPFGIRLAVPSASCPAAQL